MKAVYLTGIGQLEFMEVDTPGPPGPGEVLLKVENVGVCGSDVHYYREGGIGEQIVAYPHRVGHEASARIESVGPGATGLSQGSLVAVEPAVSCHKCTQCRAGRPNTCENLRFLGCPGEMDGCLCEYIVMPADCCFPVPETMSPEEAALVEPFSIAVYAVHAAGNVSGRSVGVLGTGPIGLSVLMVANSRGGRVYATDKLSPRLRKSLEAGAVWAANPLETDIEAEIRELEPKGLDVVLECCGQQEALDQAIEILKPGGRLMIIGIPTGNRVSFSADKMRRKEITIHNIRRQNGCVPAAIDWISTHDVAGFVTHRFPLDRTRQAFDLVAGYKDGVMKAMIDIRDRTSRMGSS